MAESQESKRSEHEARMSALFDEVKKLGPPSGPVITARSGSISGSSDQNRGQGEEDSMGSSRSEEREDRGREGEVVPPSSATGQEGVKPGLDDELEGMPVYQAEEEEEEGWNFSLPRVGLEELDRQADNLPRELANTGAEAQDDPQAARLSDGGEERMGDVSHVPANPTLTPSPEWSLDGDYPLPSEGVGASSQERSECVFPEPEVGEKNREREERPVSPVMNIKDEPIDEGYDNALLPSTRSIKEELDHQEEELRISSVFSVGGTSYGSPTAPAPQTSSSSIFGPGRGVAPQMGTGALFPSRALAPAAPPAPAPNPAPPPQPPSLAPAIRISCSGCSKILLKGMTAFQRKGSSQLFCSTVCLTGFNPSVTKTRSCAQCLKEMDNPTEVISAIVETNGTTRDFCSQFCMVVYKRRRRDIELLGRERESIPPAQITALNTPSVVDSVESIPRCSVCNISSMVEHEVSHQGVLHRLCSDRCFYSFCCTHHLVMNSCYSCGMYCNSNASNCQILRMSGVNLKFCSPTCITTYRQTSTKVIPCPRCNDWRIMSDMVESLDIHGKIKLFCSSKCAPTAALNSLSGKKFHCTFCKGLAVPQYHLAAVDGTIRNFCSYNCAASQRTAYPMNSALPQMNGSTPSPVVAPPHRNVSGTAAFNGHHPYPQPRAPTIGHPYAPTQSQPSTGHPYAPTQSQPSTGHPYTTTQSQPSTGHPYAPTQSQSIAGHPYAPTQSQPSTGHPYAPTQSQPSTGHPYPPTQSQPSTGHPYAPTQSQPSTGHPYAPTQSQPSTGHPYAPTQSQPSTGHPYPPTQSQPSTAPYTPAAPSWPRHIAPYQHDIPLPGAQRWAARLTCYQCCKQFSNKPEVFQHKEKSSYENCTLGKGLSDRCHLLDYTRRVGLKPLRSLREGQTELLSWRTGSTCADDDTICFHHEQKLLVLYPNLQRKCCDPFGKHKKPLKKALREISVEMATNFKEILEIDVIPGKRMCPTCFIVYKQKLKSDTTDQDNSPGPDFDPVLAAEGMSPGPDFDPALAAKGMSPGPDFDPALAAEGMSPGPDFDPALAAKGMSPGPDIDPALAAEIILTLDSSLTDVSLTSPPQLHRLASHYQGRVLQFCGQRCCEEFKTGRNITVSCEYCKGNKVCKDIVRYKAVDRPFCSESCKLLFKDELNKQAQDSLWSSCSYCGGISQKMLHNHFGGKMKQFCHSECMSLYTVLFYEMAKCDNCRRQGRMKEQLKCSGLLKHFCNLPCLLQYCYQTFPQNPRRSNVPSGGVSALPAPPAAPVHPPSYQSQAAPVIADVVSLANAPAGQPRTADTALTGSLPTSNSYGKSLGDASTQTDAMKLPAARRRVMKNKALMCKPFTLDQETLCHLNTQATETPSGSSECSFTTTVNNEKLRVVVLPVPVPVFIPVPMHMYTQYTPVHVPIPVPIPVPMVIPPTLSQSETRDVKDPDQSQAMEEAEEEEAEEEDDEEEEVEKDKPVSHGDQGSTYSGDLESEAVSTPLHGSSPPLSWEEESTAATAQRRSLRGGPGAADPSSTCPPSSPSLADLEADFPPELFDPAAAKEPQRPTVKHRGRKRLRDGFPPKKRTRKRAGSGSGSVEPSLSLRLSPARAKLHHMYGVKAWKNWVVQREGKTSGEQPGGEEPNAAVPPVSLKGDVLQCDSSELSYGLCRFICELRRPSGQTYTPDSIFYLCLGIQQYLFENGRIENIFTDDFYSQFTMEITRLLRNWRPTLLPSGYLHSRVEEDYLWECKQLGAYSPIVLLNTLLFFSTKMFRFTTLAQHRRLSFTNFSRCTRSAKTAKNSFLRFRPTDRTNPEQPVLPAKRKMEEEEGDMEMLENTENPLRCPVRLYQFYLSKCSESVKKSRDLFYLQPETSCHPNSPLWYSSQPLEGATLESMLTRILAVREVHLDSPQLGLQHHPSTSAASTDDEST